MVALRSRVVQIEQADQRVAGYRLVFYEVLGHLDQLGLAVDEYLAGRLVGVVGQGLDLDVDFLGHVVSVVPLLADFPSQEHHLLPLAEGAGSQGLAHAVPLDHAQGNLSGLLQVVAGAGRDLVEDQFLGHPSTHGYGQHVLELVLSPEITVFLGKQGRMPAHVAPGHDGNLVDPVGVGQGPGHQGVTRLVVGRHFLFSDADDPALPLRAGDDPLHRFLKLGHVDCLQVLSGSQQGGLVDQIGQVSAAEPGCFLGQGVHLDLGGDGLSGGVDVEDGLASRDVGQVQGDAAVEAPGTQQCRVEDVGAVGGCDDDDVGVGLEAVHLHQDLVQGLFPLVVASAQSGSPVAAHGVNLVDEDYAGGVALGLVEEVPHTGRTDSDEHFNELAAADVEEGHPCLAGNGAGQQGLARARRANQQHSLGDAGAQGQEPLRVLEELDDFLEFLFGLVHSRHIVEGNGGAVEGQHPGPAASEAEGLVVASLGLAHHEQDQAAEEDQRQEVKQDSEEAAQAAGALEHHLDS